MTKASEIFPTTECGRCGGSGRYSYNQIDGDRCYGCGGTGKAYASKKIAEAAAAYNEALKSAKQPVAKNLAVGDKVLDDLSYRADGSQQWTTVTDIVVTDEVCGWSGVERTPTSWYLMITLATGTVRKINGSTIVRRHSGSIDLTPFLEMAGVA